MRRGGELRGAGRQRLHRHVQGWQSLPRLCEGRPRDRREEIAGAPASLVHFARDNAPSSPKDTGESMSRTRLAALAFAALAAGIAAAGEVVLYSSNSVDAINAVTEEFNR